MADQSSTVIIDVNIKQEDAMARAHALNDQIIALKDNQDKLKASGQQLGITYKQNATEISKLQSEVKAYLALSKNQDGSINSLRGQITILTNQYNALSKAERENGVAGQVLQKQLKSLNEEERKASQSAGNFKTSIATYSDAIKGAIQNMLPFGSEVGRGFAAVNSLSGAFKGAAGSIEIFKTALITTGIGALVVALGSVITYLKDLDTVADTTGQVLSGFKGVVNELGRSLLNLDFKGLTNRMVEAGAKAMVVAEEQQDIEDKMLAQSVKSADAQAKVAQKRAEAMNRALDPKQRQKLLEQADEIDREDLETRKKIADQQIEIAQNSIILTGNLNKAQQAALKKNGVEAALDFQNNLVKQGKVTDEQTKKLAESLKNRDQIQNEYTLRDEKRNNLSDRIAMQAEAKQEQLRAKQKAAEEKRKAELDKINEDRVKSLLYSSQSILTIRQKEVSDINADIDKRVTMYQKYGQSTVQLEIERQQRIRAVSDKFHKEDLAQIQKNLREVELANIKSGSGTPEQKDVLTNRANTKFGVQDIDASIADIKQRIAAGEDGLSELLQSYVDKRASAVQAGLYSEQQMRDEANKNRLQHERDLEDAILENAISANQAKQALNTELLGSYENLFGTIAGLAGDQSTIGKAAFVLEKSLAIAQIIINAELEKSNVRLAAAKQAATLASIPVFGAIFAAVAIAAGEAQATAITVREVASAGIIAAQTIAAVAFARGGKVSGPGTGTSDSIPARLSNGESVINAKSTKMFAPLLSDINVAGGGKAFASGGIAGSYVPNLAQQINNNNAVSRSIASSIKGVRNVVYVESIVDGLDRNTVTVENANF